MTSWELPQVFANPSEAQDIHYRPAMTRDNFNRFCASLPATSHVVQWGGADVWKVGPKVFAICGWNEGRVPGVTFKTSDISYEILCDMPGMRPAPYLASRGMKWIQRYDDPSLSDDALKHYLAESYRIVASGLSRKKRREIGLESASIRSPTLDQPVKRRKLG
jgi:predicted DNA-binding protein (MmcQ/YjbR family)